MSAGTDPGPRSHFELIAVIGKAGFDLTGAPTTKLTPELTAGHSMLLATVVAPIHISRAVADDIAAALAGSEGEGERDRQEVGARLEQRRRTVSAKLDRGYDDYVNGRISEEFFRRKSQEWEADLQTVDAERARVEQPRPPVMATAEKILELAKQAETILSNCSFDRGNLCPTYSKPFDLRAWH